MEVLDHGVFVLDIILDSVEVVRSLTKVLFLSPILLFLSLLGDREDVFDCVGNNEIFVRFQALHRSLVDFWNSFLLVSAVVGEVANCL